MLKYIKNYFSNFKVILYKSYNGPGLCFHLGKNKVLELQLIFDVTLYFCVSGFIRRRADHPGVGLEVNVLGLGFDIDYYDGRHWSNEKGRLLEFGEPEDDYTGGYN